MGKNYGRNNKKHNRLRLNAGIIGWVCTGQDVRVSVCNNALEKSFALHGPIVANA